MIQPPEFDWGDSLTDQQLRRLMAPTEAWTPPAEYQWAIYGERRALLIRYMGAIPGLLRTGTLLRAFNPSLRAGDLAKGSQQVGLVLARQDSFAERLAADEVDVALLLDRQALSQCYERLARAHGLETAREVTAGQAHSLRSAMDAGWVIRLADNPVSAPHATSGVSFDYVLHSGGAALGVYRQYADAPGVPHESWDAGPEPVQQFYEQYSRHARQAANEPQTVEHFMAWERGGGQLVNL